MAKPTVEGRVNEIKSLLWRTREKAAGTNKTLDRELMMAQLEMMAILGTELAEMNGQLKRIGVVNFEELALRLDAVFKQGEQEFRALRDKHD